MKHRLVWAGALALAITAISQVQTLGATNGVIFISARAPQDTAAGSEYFSSNNGEPGPGMITPGDVEMGTLLSDYGYSCRLLLDKILGDTASGWATFPPVRDTFMFPVKTNFAPRLLVVSGSSAGADVPFPTQTNGVPIMMGEHTTISDNATRAGSIYMYANQADSNDPNGNATTTFPTKYMKVVNTTHPIMQGIPLDAEGRVKIFREPYPEENAYIPSRDPLNPDEGAPKQNYEYRWCTQNISNAAPGTVVLGVLAGTNAPTTGKDGDSTNRVCFAVCDVGGTLAVNQNLGYAETSQVRLVHFFVNENGSGGARRVFLALTDLGRVLFVRAAKWAMGDPLQPYQPLGLIRVSQTGTSQIRLAWDGTATKSYKVLGSADLFAVPATWQTVAQDIPGLNGEVSATFDISAAPQYAFLRVMPVP